MGGSGGSTGGPAAAVGGLKESLPKNHTGETEIINNVKVPSYAAVCAPLKCRSAWKKQRQKM